MELQQNSNRYWCNYLNEHFFRVGFSCSAKSLEFHGMNQLRVMSCSTCDVNSAVTNILTCKPALTNSDKVLTVRTFFNGLNNINQDLKKDFFNGFSVLGKYNTGEHKTFQEWLLNLAMTNHSIWLISVTNRKRFGFFGFLNKNCNFSSCSIMYSNPSGDIYSHKKVRKTLRGTQQPSVWSVWFAMPKCQLPQTENYLHGTCKCRMCLIWFHWRSGEECVLPHINPTF